MRVHCISFYEIWRATIPFSICLSTVCTIHYTLYERIFNKNTLIRLFYTLFIRLSATTATATAVKLFRVIWRLFCSEIHECKREHSNVNVCTNRKHRSPLVTLVWCHSICSHLQIRLRCLSGVLCMVPVQATPSYECWVRFCHLTNCWIRNRCSVSLSAFGSLSVCDAQI